jgi:adenine-specific DNA-methyltransferase
MEKLKMHSLNLTNDNIMKIRELFPGCVTEAKDENGNLRLAVDFDQLRQELSDHVVEGLQERYHLSWPGKREALLAANAPVAKTLRPCREESVNFDTTKNLFIEGDNLEALKLLQETYLGKLKVIYIDPPYNTGSDFLYEDDFAENTEGFIRRSNQKDDSGNRLVANLETNGRFHSDWLSMMYPRLKIASNLLADDGLLAVTISDKELFQLGKILDEIFGPSNKLACAPWLSEASGGKEKTGLRTGHEYFLIYYKSSSESVSQDERSTGQLNLKDKWGPYRKGRELMKWGGVSLRKDRPNQFYGLMTPHGEEVFPYRNDGEEGHWRWGKENQSIKIAQEDPDFFHWEKRPFDTGICVNGKTERWVPYEKIRDSKKSVGWSTWLDKYGTNADGTRELKDLFGFKVFDTPKPTQLVEWFLSLHASNDCIVMDFFSGSAVTAHAMMKLNADDGGTRRFIMVQLPESCDEQSLAYKNGYRTISGIAKERIRRAGQ